MRMDYLLVIQTKRVVVVVPGYMSSFMHEHCELAGDCCMGVYRYCGYPIDSEVMHV